MSRGDSLIPAAASLLRDEWGRAVPVLSTVVDFPHRAVFVSRAPDGTEVYVKVEAGDRRFRRELSALRLLTPSPVPVPPVLLALPGELSVLVLGALQGLPLSGAGAPAWSAAGACLRDLHAVAPTDEVRPFGDASTGWLEHVREWAAAERAEVVESRLMEQSLVEAVYDRIRSCLDDTAAPQPVVLHGDCQPAHVLLGRAGQVTGVLDFGDAGTGDALWDVAVLTGHHRDRAEQVLDGYGWQPAALTATRSALTAYWGVRHLSAATWSVAHGFDPAPELRAAADLVSRPSR